MFSNWSESNMDNLRLTIACKIQGIFDKYVAKQTLLKQVWNADGVVVDQLVYY